MKALIPMMCGAALLSFGVAQAGDAVMAADPTPAGYTVVEENARIASLDTIYGYQIIDRDTISVRTSRGLYLVDMTGSCGRGARFDWSVAIDDVGGTGIDKFSRVHVNGRTCGIRALTRVERVEAQNTH